MINSVLLDMDGTLTNFGAGVLKAFDVTEKELYEKWPPGKWEMEEALGYDIDEFWEQIDEYRNFWIDLEFMPDAKEILSIVESYFGEENIVLCTSPPRNPEATAQKVAWIQKHLPKYERRFCVTPCKELLAHPSALLIDDYDRNVDRFRERGGNAILLPRRWNSNWKMEKEKTYLDALCLFFHSGFHIK